MMQNEIIFNDNYNFSVRFFYDDGMAEKVSIKKILDKARMKVSELNLCDKICPFQSFSNSQSVFEQILNNNLKQILWW
jgi:hypothetical protein